MVARNFVFRLNRKAKSGSTTSKSVAVQFMLVLLTFMLVVESHPAIAQGFVRPKLVLLLVIDQFSYDYLSRYQDKFSSGGIRMLLDRGASFTHCRFENANTRSAVGHSIIATGAYPWATGIVGDSWYDRRHTKSITPVTVLDDAPLWSAAMALPAVPGICKAPLSVTR